MVNPKMKKIFLACLLFTTVFTYGQTTEELRALKKEKKDSISAIQSRVDAIQKRLDNLPGWRYGAFGTVGGSFSGFDNWYAQGTPNVSSGNIAVTLNTYANLKQAEYFWRNSLNVNLAWVKFDDKDDPNDDDSFRESTDVFNISSLYGYNLTDKLALSGLGEYRTTLITNINNPGYLDIGVGLTWTPVDNLVITVNPLNYNFVFSDDDNIYDSSAGTKFLVDYTRKFGKVSLKSNFSGFLSYKDSNYSNYTWTNSLGYTLWKNFGVGFEFGLRDNKQEALDYAINKQPEPDADANFNSIDNKLQTYYVLGINYSF